MTVFSGGVVLLITEEQASKRDHPGGFPPTCGKPIGGRPSQHIIMTEHGFEQLCMAANTDKARRVRDYYIAMEEVME